MSLEGVFATVGEIHCHHHQGVALWWAAAAGFELLPLATTTPGTENDTVHVDRSLPLRNEIPRQSSGCDVVCAMNLQVAKHGH